MLVSKNGKDVYEASEGLLKTHGGAAIGRFKSADKLLDYLKQHPDTTFLFEADKLGKELPNGVQPGDIVAGEIHYDSATDKVVTK